MNQIETSNIADQELMGRIASNDLGAWAELVKRYSNLVYSISFQVLKNDSDTEDAVQDTFISLKIYANKFDSTQDLKPWLSRVAANQAIRIYKKRKKNNHKETNWMKTKSVSEDSQKLDVASISEKQEVQLMVRKAIDTLPEASRVALTLYFGGGMNQSEIAIELGLSQFSISEKIKIGLEKVKSYLTKSGIYASIAVSPQLLKESIVSAATPNALLVKLSNQLPSASQIEKVASISKKVGVATSKSKTSLAFIAAILGTTIAIIIGVLFFNAKKKEVVDSPLRNLSNKQNSLRSFIPIDFAGIFMFNVNLVANNGSSTIAALPESTLNNWKVSDMTLGGKGIIRNFYQKGVNDGFLLSNCFRKASLLQGRIKLNSEKTDFYFSLNTSKVKQKEVTNKDIQNYISNIYSGRTMKIYLLPNEEIDFKLYVWPNANKWEAICLVYLNGKHMPDQDYYCWQEFTIQECSLSLFTDGKVAINKFEYCELEPGWKAETEPDLKYTMNQISEKPFLKK